MNEKGFSATRENGTKYGAKLRDAVIHQASWGTPKEQDSRAAMTLGRQVNGWQPKSQLDQTKSNTNGKPLVSLKLNPDWVEQLMGLPIGWTDFDFSEME
jgi:hypothetical protein